MDINTVRSFAGLPVTQFSIDKEFKQLNEVVELPADISLEELQKRLEACSRALGIANKLEGLDKKKWVSAVFVNLNKVRAALQRALAAQPA